MGKKKGIWGRWIASGGHFAEGGQGLVYLVTDQKGEYNGEYVLKELKKPKRSGRFDAELNAITSLVPHPHVISLIDSGIYRYEDKPCFVMPKADRNLNDLIKEYRVDLEKRLLIFDKICQGVAHLHSSSPQIIHRDLKPENVLMFSDEPVISDLGLCLLVGTIRITPHSEAVGPRFYMAPELEDGRQPDVDIKADVYSLGKLLYYLLSNGRIFSREKYREKGWLLSSILQDKRYEIFEKIFDKSITSDTQQRYANASELMESFRTATDSFHGHPLTLLLHKFGSIDQALDAPESRLSSLSKDEWAELLKHAQGRTDVNDELLRVACDALDPSFVELFSKTLLANKSHLDRHLVASAAGRILCLPRFEGWFRVWLYNEDNFSDLALLALNIGEEEILNKVARWDSLTLRNCDEVLSILAQNFNELRPEAKHDFLFASCKSNYQDKEAFLLRLSNSEDIDGFLDGVVAGLCACATEATLNRIVELFGTAVAANNFEAVSKGVLLGASVETAKWLRQHSMGNPVLEIILEAMSETDDLRSSDDQSEDE